MMAIILQKLEEIKEEIKETRVEILQEVRAAHAAGEANATARLRNIRVGMENRLDPVVAAATHEAPLGVPNTIQQVGTAWVNIYPTNPCLVGAAVQWQLGQYVPTPSPTHPQLPTLWDIPRSPRGSQYHPAGVCHSAVQWLGPQPARKLPTLCDSPSTVIK